jgi:hypothetical protein
MLFRGVVGLLVTALTVTVEDVRPWRDMLRQLGLLGFLTLFMYG